MEQSEYQHIIELLSEMRADIAVIKQRIATSESQYSRLPCESHAQTIARLQTVAEVLQERINPVRMVVYGAIGLSLSALAGAMVATVMK